MRSCTRPPLLGRDGAGQPSGMAQDQTTTQDPRTQHPQPEQPGQQIEHPGREGELDPQPDYGEASYRGSGRLEGRRALITGGDSGIGRAVALAFAREGADVVISHLAEEQADADETVRVVKDAGRKGLALPGDLTEAGYCREIVERTVSELGGIDLLVNNVGVGDTEEFSKGVLLNLLDLPEDAWRHTFDLHFYSALRASRAALPHLVASRGTIINVSSVGARAVGAGPANYNVAKAALSALTKVIAEQFGERGVRAVTVSPGAVNTAVWADPDGFVAGLAKEQGVPHETFVEQALAGFGVTTGRVSAPQEVARLIAFLASPLNVTGSEYLIDGGMIKHV
jgi:NAD(P)-dependent dehydrogenase (short-subunit alcohol dehydrogenase family)